MVVVGFGRYFNAKTDEIPGVEAAAWLSRRTTVIHNYFNQPAPARSRLCGRA
jgi:hypothetical protein